MFNILPSEKYTKTGSVSTLTENMADRRNSLIKTI